MERFVPAYCVEVLAGLGKINKLVVWSPSIWIVRRYLYEAASYTSTVAPA